MKILTRLAVIALLLGSVACTASAYAEDARTCHLPPITGSQGGLQYGQTVGVLYSEDTVENLQYLEQYHSVAVTARRTHWMRGFARRSSTAPIRTWPSTG